MVEKSYHRSSYLTLTLILMLLASIFVNFVLFVILLNEFTSELSGNTESLIETFVLGDRDAKDKIAVINVSGLLTESEVAYPIQQLETAARDKRVKAVVLRIDTPGGLVTASDELYHCVLNVRDDTKRRFESTGKKPVVVSMGAMATSGGYYVAVAGSPILAERTTLTGSIGVFAALPNISELAQNNGVKLEIIKAGPMKASGSFFHALSPEERQTWQDSVDSAYECFLTVIEQGRPHLTRKRLTQDIVINRKVPVRDDKGNTTGKEVDYQRTLADGATFTAEQAKEFGLIDEIGDLPRAISIAAQLAQSSAYKAVSFVRPPTLLKSLTGIEASTNSSDLARIASVLSPRLWYLASPVETTILNCPSP